jgi:hypothetical protein
VTGGSLIIPIQMQRSRARSGHIPEVVSICGLFAAMLTPAPVLAADPAIRVASLSNRPDRISGGDALVRIDLPPAASAGQAVMRLNAATSLPCSIWTRREDP